MWDGSWGQSVKAPLCHYFLLILVPFLVVHRLQCTCSDVVLSRGCRGISFPPFSLTLLSAVLCEIARMWNKHIPHLSFWNCHAVFKKKNVFKIRFPKYTFPAVPPPWLWGSDMPWDGMFAATGISCVQHGAALTTPSRGFWGPCCQHWGIWTQYIKSERPILFHPFSENCDFGNLTLKLIWALQ